MAAIAYSIWLSLYIDIVCESIAYVNVTNCLVYQLCGGHVKFGPCKILLFCFPHFVLSSVSHVPRDETILLPKQNFNIDYKLF